MQTHGLMSDRLMIGAVVCGLFALAAPSGASAETYAGVGLGKAAVELDGFDENDGSKKVIVGYVFDLPAVDFSVEGGYVDFGSPSDGASGAALDISGLNAFAVAGIDFGLVGLFGKAGVIAWNADASIPGISASEDGSDPAYGIGVRFNIGSVDIRTEYEKFDIDGADDLDMISASFIWRF